MLSAFLSLSCSFRTLVPGGASTKAALGGLLLKIATAATKGYLFCDLPFLYSDRAARVILRNQQLGLGELGRGKGGQVYS